VADADRKVSDKTYQVVERWKISSGIRKNILLTFLHFIENLFIYCCVLGHYGTNTVWKLKVLTI